MKIILGCLLLVLAGCASTDTTHLTDAGKPLPPKIASSPVDTALNCIRGSVPDNPFDIPKIGVSVIGNNSGIYDYEGQGNYVQSDISHVFTTALKKAGMRVLNREGGTQAIIEWELNHAINNRLGHHEPTYITNPQGGDPISVRFRPVGVGALLGSDLVLVGSINRLDFDTSSSGIEVYINGYSLGRRSYSALVGMDLSLVDTQTTEVVWAQQYEQEYWGLENRGGVFKTLNQDNLIDINLGVQTSQPLMAGVVDIANYAAYEMAKYLYAANDVCDSTLD